MTIENRCRTGPTLERAKCGVNSHGNHTHSDATANRGTKTRIDTHSPLSTQKRSITLAQKRRRRTASNRCITKIFNTIEHVTTKQIVPHQLIAKKSRRNRHKNILVVHPVKNCFPKLLDYKTYRVKDMSSFYDVEVAWSVYKYAKRIQGQMRSQVLNVFDLPLFSVSYRILNCRVIRMHTWKSPPLAVTLLYEAIHRHFALCRHCSEIEVA